jgi:hypothetical protein
MQHLNLGLRLACFERMCSNFSVDHAIVPLELGLIRRQYKRYLCI